jgi:hypothetical protein
LIGFSEGIDLVHALPFRGRSPRSVAMKKLLIPWQVFRDALKEQEPNNLDRWLRRWLFTDEGILTTEAEAEPGEPSLSLESVYRDHLMSRLL